MPVFKCQKHSKDMIERIENQKIIPYCSSCLIESIYKEKYQRYLETKEFHDREYRKGKIKFLLTEIFQSTTIGLIACLIIFNGFTFFKFWEMSIWVSITLTIIMLLIIAKRGGFSYGHNAYSKPTMERIEEELRDQVIADAMEIVKFKADLNVEYYARSVQMEQIDLMGGFEFEEFIAELLTNIGFKNVKVTSKTGDGGVDIIANDTVGNSVAVQCKRVGSKVGNSALQEIHLGKELYNCQRAMVITNSFFTKPAIDASKKIQVELWDRDKLIDELRKVEIKVTWEDFLLQHYNVPS
ncbi:hypothetical protein CN481_00225 [Bacillus sp. AFS006103]|nr:hypothetical protein CN481_00225 [Bacillus sp. AFS006103]